MHSTTDAVAAPAATGSPPYASGEFARNDADINSAKGPEPITVAKVYVRSRRRFRADGSGSGGTPRFNHPGPE
ncbi:hypothetical protein GALLR39Z86_33560 [Glycomyces algeriensis]|uniref:Uncharacterized protein n=1 Tax=Glycomyces algeriensis TaxID=256037 RepID=A0A9W6GAJ6_9ACTN|nr:hypothetical protein GALLR39Z86_33560 [Glycomyces algeriensis]